MKFAKWTFRLAGIYGLIVLLPQYFLFDQTGLDQPPVITHPEYFYGFVGVAIAWQAVFLLIGSDPARYRPIMLAGVLEKLSFGIAAAILFAQHRLAVPLFVGGCIDLELALMFTIAWWIGAPGKLATDVGAKPQAAA